MENCVVLAVMATRSREDSDIDPLEDEMEFTKAMRLAGFKKQLNFQMPLTVPAEEFLDGTPIDRLKVFLCFVFEFLQILVPYE